MIIDVCSTIRGGDWTGKSNKINEEINRKYAIFCRDLTKIYSTSSPKYIRLTDDPFEPTRGDYWTNYWQGLDENIFNIILGVCQTKITTHPDVQEATV